MKKLFAAAAMAALLPMASAHAAELLSNGTFDAGNTGFSSDYAYAPLNGLGTNLWPEATYDVSTNPHSDHYLFTSMADHTPGADTGLMMVANGSGVLDAKIWSESIAAASNTSFTFSFWLASVYPESPAMLSLWLNGAKTSVAFNAVVNADTPTGTWRQFSYTGNTGAAGLHSIGLSNNNLAPSGNDFALDDMSLQSAAVPEPASWALMLIGFGSLGAVLRRNRRRGFATA